MPSAWREHYLQYDIAKNGNLLAILFLNLAQYFISRDSPVTASSGYGKVGYYFFLEKLIEVYTVLVDTILCDFTRLSQSTEIHKGT